MTDYLIIGQGIAGTNLALTLLEAGKSIKIADFSQPFSATKSAAGLFNPITGRKMNKTWLADDLFPYLHDFYPKQEKLLGSKFFHSMPIYVPFDSVEKQNNWAGASSETKYEGFVGGFVETKYQGLLKSHFGGMELNQSGYVETREYLQSARNYLKAQSVLVDKWVDVADLQLQENSVKWQGDTFKKVIFADGPQGAENSFFQGLDYRRVKGEILLVEFEQPYFQNILNRGCWMIPVGGAKYRVGSTFDWRDLSTDPTESGRLKVEEKLNELVDIPYKVLDHWAGVRPATYDRRPFIGLHPKYPQIGLFNGMGSKGISLSPFIAKHFVDFLENGKPLMPEVNLNRKFNYQ